jgi:hypothetical protein
LPNGSSFVVRRSYFKGYYCSRAVKDILFRIPVMFMFVMLINISFIHCVREKKKTGKRRREEGVACCYKVG